MSIKKRYYLAAIKGILIGLLFGIIVLSKKWIEYTNNNVGIAGYNGLDSTEIFIGSILLCGGIVIIVTLLILHRISKNTTP